MISSHVILVTASNLHKHIVGMARLRTVQDLAKFPLPKESGIRSGLSVRLSSGLWIGWMRAVEAAIPRARFFSPPLLQRQFFKGILAFSAVPSLASHPFLSSPSLPRYFAPPLLQGYSLVGNVFSLVDCSIYQRTYPWHQ